MSPQLKKTIEKKEPRKNKKQSTTTFTVQLKESLKDKVSNITSTKKEKKTVQQSPKEEKEKAFFKVERMKKTGMNKNHSLIELDYKSIELDHSLRD